MAYFSQYFPFSGLVIEKRINPTLCIISAFNALSLNGSFSLQCANLMVFPPSLHSSKN